MQRYYFHIFDGADTYDDAGTMCDGIRAVRLHMLSLARQAVESADPQKPTWSIEALDSKGKIVGSLDFGLLS